MSSSPHELSAISREIFLLSQRSAPHYLPLPSPCRRAWMIAWIRVPLAGGDHRCLDRRSVVQWRRRASMGLEDQIKATARSSERDLPAVVSGSGSDGRMLRAGFRLGRVVTVAPWRSVNTLRLSPGPTTATRLGLRAAWIHSPGGGWGHATIPPAPSTPIAGLEDPLLLVGFPAVGPPHSPRGMAQAWSGPWEAWVGPQGDATDAGRAWVTAPAAPCGSPARRDRRPVARPRPAESPVAAAGRCGDGSRPAGRARWPAAAAPPTGA